MPLVALAAGLMVAALLIAFGPLRREATAERATLSLGGAALGLAVLSWLAMRLGAYSLWRVVPLLLLLTGAGFWAARRLGASEAVALGSTEERGGRLALALLVCFGTLYWLHPTYFLLGGQDPGVYFEFAAHIAKTGGLDLDLPWLRQVKESHGLGGICLGYPGVYSLLQSSVSNDPSRLNPQFVHLFPALAANAWAVGGVEGTVRVNAVLAVLVLGLGFVLVRRLSGFGAALAFVVVLGINPAFVWGARITLTEILAAGLTVAGLLLLFLAAERQGRGFAVAAGFVLGVGVFNRLDAGFSGLLLLGFGLSTVVDPTRARAARVAAVSYLVPSCLAYLDARLSSRFYFEALFERHHLAPLMALSTLSALLGLAASSLPTRWRERLPKRLLPALGYGMLGALALWLSFALLVWPKLDPGSDARSARELGWYLTPVVWPLLMLGLALLLRGRVWHRSLPILILTGGTLVAFTAGPNVVPEHIWASRRWLSQVIPLGLLLAVVAADALVRLLARVRTLAFAIGVAFGASYLVPAISFARPFLFRTMYAGLPQAYTSLIGRIAASGLQPPLLTAHPHLASILTYVYDVPTVLFGSPTKHGATDESRALLERGEFAGWDAVGLDAFELNATPVTTARFEGEYLEGAVGKPPREVVARPIVLDIGRIGGRTYELELPARHRRFGSDVGAPGPDGSLKTTGVAGTLLRGPGTELAPGQYEVDWLGRVWNSGRPERQGTLEVTSEGVVVASMPLRLRAGATEAWLGGVDFGAAHTLPSVEFRLQVADDVELELTRVRLRRIVLGGY